MNQSQIAGNVPIVGEHLAAVRFGASFLVGLCVPRPSAMQTMSGIPEDAQLVQMSIQPDGTVVLILRHPSFPLATAAGMVPEITVGVRHLEVRDDGGEGGGEEPPADPPPSPSSVEDHLRRVMAESLREQAAKRGLTLVGAGSGS